MIRGRYFAIALSLNISAIAATTPTPVASSTEWISKVTDPVFLVMNKEQSVLRFHSLKDGALLGQLRAISGLNPGDKEVEGDRKTPEGIYTILRQIPKAGLASLHGSAAYELNYPNLYDRLKKKSGSGIWIHGVEKEDRLSRGTDTRGCVALSNFDVVDIKKLFRFGQTPVMIIDKENAEHAVGYESGSGLFTKRLEAWAAAWSSKNMEEYLKFYHPNFKSKGMDLKAWGEYKGRLARVYKSIDVKLSNIKVLVHPKYSVAYFVQDYQSNRLRSLSEKRVLFIGGPTDAQILAEEVTREGISPVPAGIQPVAGSEEDPVALSKK